VIKQERRNPAAPTRTRKFTALATHAARVDVGSVELARGQCPLPHDEKNKPWDCPGFVDTLITLQGGTPA
jgi:hypothetical protein